MQKLIEEYNASIFVVTDSKQYDKNDDIKSFLF
jgi:hypothetical protein